jgi:hypothetical protein
MIWLRESYVPNKTSLKINRAEEQPGQPLGMFQISHLLQITRLSFTTVQKAAFKPGWVPGEQETVPTQANPELVTYLS